MSPEDATEADVTVGARVAALRKAKQSKESIAGRFRQGCWRVVPALQVSYQTVEQQQASGFICVNEKHALVEPAE
jgi:hypothetical protein